jgi:hypothetical protein
MAKLATPKQTPQTPADRLEQGPLHEKPKGFSGMPRPPRKPEPVPQPGDEGKE